MGRLKTSKTIEAELSFRVLNGYFMNQYFPLFPNPNNKAPLYKNLEPEGMSYEDAL